MSKKKQDDWNPLDPSVLGDQRCAYDEMRERCPAAYSDFMGWSLFRYQDVTAVLADVETYSNKSLFLAIPNGMDPPVHEQYRKLLAPHFSQESMSRIEPRARQIARALMTPYLDERVEFIEFFVTPFVLKTLCAFLGWPEDQWEDIRAWVYGNQQAALNKDSALGKKLAETFSKQVKFNLQKRRLSSNEFGDITEALLKTEIDGALLNDEQIVSILRNWVAGHGTVAAGLGLLVFHLAQNVELQNQLRNDHSLISKAIEEILRLEGPLVANRRITTKEVKIADRVISEGETLSLMWIAANRDPNVFDKPNEIQIERDTAKSLLWGQGIHFCLGAPLARLEMRVALEELLLQTKCFELTGTQRRAVYPSNGFAELTLRLHKLHG